jgi:hypothetical protein
MTPTYRAILAAALLVGPAIVSAQNKPRITAAEIDGHLPFLSSDLLGGSCSRGVEPGVNGSYFQDLPIDIVGTDVSSITIAASGKATSSLQWDDFKDVDVKGKILLVNKDAEFHSPSVATQP